MWRALRAQGVFLGRGAPGKVAFLYTGQGSQYVNMLAELREREPIVAGVFADADRVMTPLLGRPLSEFIFVDGSDPATVAQLEDDLKQTEITQPAVLATDLALTRMLAAYGVEPDLVMGHSLGEYGALVAADALDFDHALEAVSARGHEMASLQIEDKGAMAAVFGPMEEIERIVDTVDGYVVVANVNSTTQAVIGGATRAVEEAVRRLEDAGMTAMRIPVSHAFHTSIVAPASEPLRQVLTRLGLRAPRIPLVANLDGEFYPTGDDAPTRMVDILGRQVASPVQFAKGLHTLYDAGARVFIEVGPKKALHGFTEDVLGSDHDDVLALFTNHPKQGDVVAFNQALCGCYAAGLGTAADAARRTDRPRPRRGAPAGAYDIGRRAGGHPRAVRRVRRTRAGDARDNRRWRTDRAAAHRTGGDHRRRARLARYRSCVRRDRDRAHPERRAVHHSDPVAAAGGDPRQAHHPTGQAGRRRPRVRDDREPGRGGQARGPGRSVRHRGGVRCRARSRRRARHRDQARDRSRVRCVTGCRYPARPALQDDEHRDPAPRSVDAARRVARRHRNRVRLGLPGPRTRSRTISNGSGPTATAATRSRRSPPCVPSCATTRPPPRRSTVGSPTLA